MTLLARLITLAATVVAVIIAAGILLVVLDANQGNSIVSTVTDWARTLASPFDGIFTPRDPKLRVGLNWGLALVVYMVAATVVARLLARASAGFGGRRRRAA